MRRLLALLVLLPLLAQAEMNFITLKHRNAENIVPLLQPVVDEGVGISGQGSTLIINSKPSQLEQIRGLVEQLDTPLQSLLISVIQGGEDNVSALHGGVSGTLEHPELRLYGTKQQTNETLSQQLRVIEGQWAFISAGESVPVTRLSTIQSPHGTTTLHSIEYKDVQSGFEVRPRISGDTVTLEIRPFRAKHSNGSAGIIEQQEINTTVSGRLGEWITLGGVAEQRQSSGTGIVYHSGKSRNANHNVKLRVERLTN